MMHISRVLKTLAVEYSVAVLVRQDSLYFMFYGQVVPKKQCWNANKM